MIRSLLGVLGLLLVAACGSGGESETSRKRISLYLAGDPVETAGYTAMIGAFEQANPDVEVELVPVAKRDQLLARLSTAFSSGDAPDVFLVNTRSYGSFQAEGALAPVQGYLDDSSAISGDEFYPRAFDAFTSTAGAAAVHAAEPLVAAGLLQRRPVRGRRADPARARLDLGRLRGDRAGADHRRGRTAWPPRRR